MFQTSSPNWLGTAIFLFGGVQENSDVTDDSFAREFSKNMNLFTGEKRYGRVKLCMCVCVMCLNCRC